jgi:NAD-dependent dihydropyrimidine dehydrogenase PreA subunit
MILHPKYFERVSLFKKIWIHRQMKKLTGDKLFKAFHLHQTKYPDQMYFYSPRMKSAPRFVGNEELLSHWLTAESCEIICPTNAIKLTKSAILIDEKKCILCGLCVELAPAGLLEMPGLDVANRPTQDGL